MQSGIGVACRAAKREQWTPEWQRAERAKGTCPASQGPRGMCTGPSWHVQTWHVVNHSMLGALAVWRRFPLKQGLSLHPKGTLKVSRYFKSRLGANFPRFSKNVDKIRPEQQHALQIAHRQRSTALGEQGWRGLCLLGADSTLISLENCKLRRTEQVRASHGGKASFCCTCGSWELCCACGGGQICKGHQP